VINLVQVLENQHQRLIEAFTQENALGRILSGRGEFCPSIRPNGSSPSINPNNPNR
jgi:hypothetical protein